jgi:hypothetical protein
MQQQQLAAFDKLPGAADEASRMWSSAHTPCTYTHAVFDVMLLHACCATTTATHRVLYTIGTRGQILRRSINSSWCLAPEICTRARINNAAERGDTA